MSVMDFFMDIGLFILDLIIEGLTAIINLFKPIWLKENRYNKQEFERKQLAAVETIREPAELKRAALEAPESDVRLAAVKKIDDPEVLKTVVLDDNDSDVRKAAVEKIDDPEVLKTVVLNDKYWDVREAAAEKIDDLEVLKNVILTDVDKDVRRAAAKKIADPETFEIVMSENTREIRTSVYELKDPSQLLILVLCAKSEDVRITALRKLDDSDLIRIVEPLIYDFETASFENKKVIADRLKKLYRKVDHSDVKAKIKTLRFGEHSDFNDHDDYWGGGSYGPPPYHEDHPGGAHTDSIRSHIDLSDL